MKTVLFILIAAALPSCGQSPEKFNIEESDHDYQNSEADTDTDTDSETDRDTDPLDSMGENTDQPYGTDTDGDQFTDSQPEFESESIEMVGTDEDSDTDTDTIADTVTNTDTDSYTDERGSDDTDQNPLIPDFVCDEWSCPDSETCDIGEYWVCPLLPEEVAIAAATYKTQWLICVEVDGDQVCPTNGYHRACAPASAIGLSCHD